METLFRKVEVKSEKDYPSESELKENFKHRPDKTIGHEEYNRIQDHFMAGAKWAIDRIKSLNSSRKESEPKLSNKSKQEILSEVTGINYFELIIEKPNIPFDKVIEAMNRIHAKTT